MEEQRKRIVVSADSIDSAGRFVTKTQRKKAPKLQKTRKAITSTNTCSNSVSPSLLKNICKTYLRNQEKLSGKDDPPKTEFQRSLDLIQSQNPSVSKAVPIDNNPGYCHRFMKPSFGCLKEGGVLPTYRTFLNKSIVPVHSTHFVPHSTITNPLTITQQSMNCTPMNTMNPYTPPVTTAMNPYTPPVTTAVNPYTPPVTTSINTIPQQINPVAITTTPEQPKQRKPSYQTIRRTFHTGKLKNGSVGVLLKNSTQRKRISQQQYSLNGIPLHKIKKKLTAAGLIKIGSDAPENILRKMYENVMMIGGPVKNYNPDIIAYNLLQHSE